MKQKYKIVYREGDRVDEEIACDGMKQADDTVAFIAQTGTVDAKGNPGIEVLLICHWVDIQEIRKVELEKGAPRIALAT